jgi:hypothetical protein
MNRYTQDWFASFLTPITPAQTDRQVAALTAWLPQTAFSRLLDLCGGLARHATALTALGYLVTGIDRDLDPADDRPDTTLAC